MTDQHVMIALPCYTGTIHLGTMRCLFSEVVNLTNAGVKVTIFDETGNSMIAHGRDMICAKFLASEATDLFFIDDDVVWEPGAMLSMLRQPVDVVACIYPQRKDPITFNCRFIQERPELWADKETGLLEVDGVPAGFLRISRKCLERMKEEYASKRFADKYAPEGYAWALFDNIHNGDLYYGEDYSFCKRWRDIGGQVWIDPRILMGHIGYKTFWGNFGEMLKARGT